MNPSDTRSREDEVVIRREPGGDWRVEMPHADDCRRMFVSIVADKTGAIVLAGQMRPHATFRIVETMDSSR